MTAKTDLAQRTLSALGWSYGGAVARMLSQMLVQLLLARFLGPEAFGQATAAFFVLGLGWLLAEGGFGSALVQKVDVDDEDVGFALGWVLLLSVGAGALVVLAATPIARWLGGEALAPLIIASGVLIPVQAVSNIPSSLMRRNLDMRRSQLIYLAGYVMAYVMIGLPMAWAGAGAWSLIAAFGVHSVINLVGSYAVTRHTLRPRLRGDASLRRFGLHVTGTNIANWSIENLDRIIVNRFWGASALGQYTAAFTLSRAPANFLVNSVQSVSLASASRLQTEPERIAKGYLATLNLTVLITGPLFAVLAVHASIVTHIVYGAKWSEAAPLFAAFCTGLPFFAILAVSGPLLWAVGDVRKEFVIQVVGAGLTLAGFMLFVGHPLSLAVWLVPLIYAFRATFVYAALKRRLPLRHRHTLRAVGPGAVLGGLAAAMCFAAIHWLPAIPALVASSAATLLVSLALLYVWPRAVLAPELAELLVGRADSSRLFAVICGPLRLRRA
jgi:O-antigen/teichoic acid export membrane protein